MCGVYVLAHTQKKIQGQNRIWICKVKASNKTPKICWNLKNVRKCLDELSCRAGLSSVPLITDPRWKISRSIFVVWSFERSLLACSTWENCLLCWHTLVTLGFTFAGWMRGCESFAAGLVYLNIVFLYFINPDFI